MASRDLSFCTAIRVSHLPLNVDARIAVGPYGRHETTIELYDIDKESEAQFTCSFPTAKSALAYLESVEKVIDPVEHADITTCDVTQERTPQSLNANNLSSEERLQLVESRPPSVVDLISAVSDLAFSETRRLLSFVRWRYARIFDYRLPRRTGIFWKSSGDMQWRRIPSRPARPSGSIKAILGIVPYPAILNDLTLRMEHGACSPIAFDLLAEAREIAYTRPSLGLVEAVQALEIGTKDTIARLIPASRDIIFDIPTPPVMKLLEDHIPPLLQMTELCSTFKAFVAERASKLRGLIHQRNRITHQGHQTSAEGVLEACDMIGDVLYYLDYICGETWAANAKWTANVLRTPH